MAAPFIHLKTHTEYSMRDGLLRIPQLVEQCAQKAMPAVAITDWHNVFAMVKFYRKAIEAGIKPIIGAEVAIMQGEQRSQATFLCQNQQGYLNLTHLLSRAYIEGQVGGEPTLQWAWLQEHHVGLIALSGGRRGNIGQALLADNRELAKKYLHAWHELFSDRFYLELTRTQRQDEETYLHLAIELACAEQVAVVATNDVCFVQASDFEAHEARVCIATGYVLDDAKRPHLYSEQQYLKSPREMAELFADVPEALANTIEIAKRCNLHLTFGEAFLPQFPLPENTTIEEYFSGQALAGLKKRLQVTKVASTEDYEARLQRELDVIIKMGFPGYFLIVADFIGWAKQQKIPVGPGRGSGAGSLVAYALGITELDPIKHELLFERFLNPERVSMPDFDIDFCMEGRDRVIEYVAERYGRDAVSQIITYGTMAAKAVVRDVGRVLGLPYGFCDKIAKLIPFELGITLDKALVQEDVLRERYQEEEEVTTLIDLAQKLEGITRNAGKHAGGVVIAPGKLTDFTPLYCEPGGENLVTQFDKDDVETIGLVKFDFLGLRTLTIINWALQAINSKQAKKIIISNIPLDDPDTFALLQSCATTAVFQLESRGMKELIRRLQPDSFEDITALVALFRPGPLQSGMVDDFIDRKHGRAVVEYPHPDLKPILRPTYGVILYQEQVMQIAQVLAGYSLGGADILRRAMGKKKPEEMAKQREVFLQGAAANNIDADTAEGIFDLMEKFAGYGFNKSHSAAYALIAYQTAWLKAHYPAEFMAAVLSSDMDNTDKVVGFLEECASMELNVLPPDINAGDYAFTANEAGAIVYGLGAIKGVGEAAVRNIAAERQAHGEYANLFDFTQRVDLGKVNRRVLEPLILAGAMDQLGPHRASLLASVDKALQTADQHAQNQSAGQDDLFGGLSAIAEDNVEQQFVNVEPWGESTLLQSEKNVLGWFVSGHPIGAYEVEINKFVTTSIAKLNHWRGKEVVLAGLLINIRPILTKSGRRMAVLTLEDRSARIEVTLFSKVFDTVAAGLATDAVFVVNGTVEDDDYTGGVRVLAESIESLDQIRARRVKRLLIKVQDQQQADHLLQHLPECITPFKGGLTPITLAYIGEDASAELVLGDAWKVKPQDELLVKLKQLCGDERVVLEYS